MEGRTERGTMKMQALLLGLWCLTLSYSTGESAAQIRLLQACAHTHSLNHSHTFILNPQYSEVNFSIKGQKALVRVELQVVCITLKC